jgi:hypothetical protein
VQLPSKEDLITYPLTSIISDRAEVRIDLGQRIRVIARDHFGLPVVGVSVRLTNERSESMAATTDQEGRTQFMAPPGATFQLSVQGGGYVSLSREPFDVNARPEEYELTLARSSRLELALEVVDQQPPQRAVAALLGATTAGTLSARWWHVKGPFLPIHSAVDRIMVFAPGFLAAEMQVSPSPEGEESYSRVPLRRGRTSEVSRALLPS